MGYRKVAASAVAALSAIVLAGCTAIDLSKLDVRDFAEIKSCKPKDQEEAALGLHLRMPAQGQVAAETEIGFVFPKKAEALGLVSMQARSAIAGSSNALSTFQEFDAATAAVVRANLPPSLQSNAVVETIRRTIVKTSARAQIQVALADEINVSQRQISEVKNYAVPAELSQSEIKEFANKLFAAGLRPTIKPTRQSANFTDGVSKEQTEVGSSKREIAGYFIAYYNGEFVDRLGQKIEKPKLGITVPIALTIPDADIAAAVAVLVEFIVDLIDPTPVLGDAKDVATITKQTKFYPGGTTNMPTALAKGFANYQQILPKKIDEKTQAGRLRLASEGKNERCGLTQENSKVLSAIANSAADNASAVSGLISQSAGGVEIGLGVLGKISIGDNQTLGTIVKSAASRLGGRIGLASSYWIITTLTNQEDPSQPQMFLEFR